MDSTQPPGAVHDDFVKWAKSKGVVINGVAPAKIPGRGLGLVATRNIKAGTELVNTPTSALLTTDSIPEDFADLHHDISVHGLLASFLANSPAARERYGPWMSTWPSWEDFWTSMPLLWPGRLFQRQGSDGPGEGWWPVPCAIGSQKAQWAYTGHKAEGASDESGESFVSRQRRKLGADLASAQAAVPEVDALTFTHMWLAVNTRSFYWDIPLERDRMLQGHEDHMVLCPFADYFNHAADANCCGVQYDADGYVVIADRDYRKGDELFVSYGAHPSELMLAEYGFVPSVNSSDGLQLDAFVLAPDSDIVRHGADIKRHGYFGDYTLFRPDGAAAVCHRTQVAVRAATMTPKRWEKFVEDDDSDDADDDKALQYIVDKVLAPFAKLARASYAQYQDDADTELWDDHDWWQEGNLDWRKRRSHIQQTLKTRWGQMIELLDALDGSALSGLIET